MKLFFVAFFTVIGLINGGYIQKRFHDSGSPEERAGVNAWLFSKLFDIDLKDFPMLYGATLFCEKYDITSKHCLGGMFVTLCRGHDECNTFVGNLESIDRMIDDKCGGVKPEEILQCMRDSANDCGTYFDPPEGCSDVINNYADWVESKFIEEEKDKESGEHHTSKKIQSASDVELLKEKRRLIELLRSKLNLSK
jgi:hypothetical protein